MTGLLAGVIAHVGKMFFNFNFYTTCRMCDLDYSNMLFWGIALENAGYSI